MGRRKPATTHGVTVVDKPAGMTSHDVVGDAAPALRRAPGRPRRHARPRRHRRAASSASGMATRLLRFVGDSRKRYIGEVVLGTETSTLDAAGEVTATHDMARCRRRRRQRRRRRAPHRRHPAGAADGVGDQGRRPAAARAGPRGHRGRARSRARSRSIASTSSRPAPGVLAIDVECSSGTYIRSLAADLGRLLGGGAHLRDLRRIAVGAFTIDEAGPPDVERAAAGRGRRAIARPRSRSATTSRPLVANGRVLAGVGRATDRGRCSTSTARCSPSTSRTASGEAKPAVVLPGAGRRVASPPCTSSPI